jgi:glycosyltransferase involved in cell wall biosynthesis
MPGLPTRKPQAYQVDLMAVYYDITTSLNWGASPVGIIRVERELGKRFYHDPELLVQFCIYSKTHRAFLEINRSVALQILEGKLNRKIIEDSLPKAPLSQFFFAQEIYNPFARYAHVMLKETDHKKAALTFEDLKKMFDREMQNWKEPTILDGFPEIKLTKDDVVISGGLDWEYKELVEINKAKLTIGFSYIAILYDLIPILYPQFVVPAYTELLASYFGELFWTADGLICISETTKKDAIAYCEKWRLTPPSLSVFSLGSDFGGKVPSKGPSTHLEAILKKIGNRRFGLYVSTLEPRKNHRILLLALWGELASGALDGDECALVFVGKRGWNIFEFLFEVEHNPIVADNIILAEDLSDEDLHLLYKAAHFALFPSYYEGYGLGLAEALREGKYVIASDAPALIEVSSGRAVHLHPNDTGAWRAALYEAFNRKESQITVEPGGFGGTWDQSYEEFKFGLRMTAGDKITRNEAAAS